MKGAGWNPAPAEARSADRRTKCEAAKPPLHPFAPDKVLTMCPYMDSSSFASTPIGGN